ncbi:MAG: lipopolysaccharide biosynthesis protein [Dysgonamonadaceae bacterium]|jgi:O-antigen/teichoic acid export membrane protein|nr:lipopolysaccharide biosynthesis protein [Dysgonamonadaceae bacterium]
MQKPEDNRSLKHKTVTGITWNLTGNLADRGITWLVNIILCRLILPAEFGILGVIAIFMAIAFSMIDSGFNSALLRKNDCTEKDYNTVFYINLGVSIFFYLLFFSTAPLMANFFNEPRLVDIVRVNSFVLILHALSMIQNVLLTKMFNFKYQAFVNITAAVVSGIVAIVLAFKGWGVWSIVIKNIVSLSVIFTLLWTKQIWRPSPVFSKESFKNLFGFGSRILISGLLNTICRNIYYPVIGKIFSKETLGFYTRAQSFSEYFSFTFSANIQRVSYPALSSIQNDDERLKTVYRSLIKVTMLITCTMTFGLAAISGPMVEALIGGIWIPCVTYIQLMCFSAIFYPLFMINTNMFNVKGRSDLSLKLEIIKQALSLPMIAVAIIWGVEALLIAGIVVAILSYLMYSYYSSGIISYSMSEQLKDIAPQFLFAGVMAFAMWTLTFFSLSAWVMLTVQIAAGATMFFIYHEYRKPEEYTELKELAITNIKKLLNKKRSTKI